MLRERERESATTDAHDVAADMGRYQPFLLERTHPILKSFSENVRGELQCSKRRYVEKYTFLGK